MRYLGGKARIAEQISEFINSAIELNKLKIYLEPFVGAAWIMERVKCPQRYGFDAHPDLILLWQALQSGWEPPSTLEESLYHELKKAEPSALRGFAGFGCSFSGKWFGGYAKDATGRNYAGNACRSLLKKKDSLSDVEFLQADYTEIQDIAGALIYCDPPYAGVTSYAGVEPFSSVDFWQWVREKSEKNLVLVSEYQAPEDFEAVLEIETRLDMQTKDSTKRIERLFRLRA
jgi:DNA adenine methylase